MWMRALAALILGHGAILGLSPAAGTNRSLRTESRVADDGLEDGLTDW